MNKRINKLISLLLTLCMLAALSACGNSSEGDISQMAAPETADEDGMVYVAEYTTLSEDNAQGAYNAVYTDGGFFTSRSVYTGTRELNEGETLEYAGQLEVWENRIYFCSYDGTERELNYRPVQPEEKIEGHEYDSWISLMSAISNGFAVIEDSYESWSDAPEGTETYSKESYIFRTFDFEGNELSRVKLSVGKMEDGEYFYPYSMLVNDDGSVVIASGGGVCVYNSDGSTAFTAETTNWVDNLIKLSDGRIFGFYYGDDGYCASQIDFEKKSVGEVINMPDDCYSCFTGGGNYDFYYTSGSNLYGYNLEKQEAVKLFNWINIDVNSNDISSIFCDSEGNFLGLINTWDSDYTSCTTELVKVSKIPASQVKNKTHITLACQSVNWDLQNLIINYNRGNSKYHIDVLDYSEYNTEDDYSAGLTKLTTELLSGNMPDILYLEGIPEEKLASKGLLEDLYTYIDNDPELDREDFFPTLLKALETDGKLYTTVSGFTLQLVAGAPSVVGDKPGWTYQEFLEAYSTMPDGCSIFSETTTREDLMYSYLPAILPDLVNESTGECDFQSEQFINFLYFVFQFPESFDWENYDWTEYEEDSARIMSGRQMLSTTYMSTFDDIQYADYQFGGKATFVGYPVETGTGNMFSVSSGYAISSGSENKEAAWDFLREFFTAEYQQDSYNFPSNISAFDSMAEKAMTPQYQTDVNGNILLDENGEKLKQSHGGYATGTGETYELYEVSAEQVDRVRNLIDTTTRLSSDGDLSEIAQIVSDESQAFFQGQKSAEDVAKLIQSKVNIYINEQR